MAWKKNLSKLNPQYNNAKIKNLLAQLFLIWLRREDLFPSREPSLVTTIRGSCATVCLFHPVHRAAAKCHYLLPVGDHDSENRSYRYVDSILPRMMKAL
jgi:hypothetical protein